MRRRRALAKAAPERLVYPVEANEMFLRVTAEEAAQLRGLGFDFYDWGPGEIRLVTSWDQQGEAVERLASAIAACECRISRLIDLSRIHWRQC